MCFPPVCSMIRQKGWRHTALLLAVLSAGCGSTSGGGQVSGTVTVDGQVPAEGSSITFLPTDGQSPSAGDLIEQGRYSADVSVGMSKVEIRVPRAVSSGANPSGSNQGPGPGAGGGRIEESLPAKYNDQTELSLDVKPGANSKNWELSTK
jgi:hypothetical protein